MTAEPGQGSAFWRFVFRSMFATGAAISWIRSKRPLPPLEELSIVGRKSGKERLVLAQLIESNGQLYVAEPSGGRSDWVENLLAAGRAEIIYRDGRRVPVIASEVPRGPVRDSVLDAQPKNQPAPMRFMYRRARHHFDAVERCILLSPDTQRTNSAG